MRPDALRLLLFTHLPKVHTNFALSQVPSELRVGEKDAPAAPCPKFLRAPTA